MIASWCECVGEFILSFVCLLARSSLSLSHKLAEEEIFYVKEICECYFSKVNAMHDFSVMYPSLYTQH